MPSWGPPSHPVCIVLRYPWLTFCIRQCAKNSTPRVLTVYFSAIRGLATRFHIATNEGHPFPCLVVLYSSLPT
jgi:hypothetical protein